MLNKWKSSLEELERDLRTNERMWSLIREIDKEIIIAANSARHGSGRDLEVILKEILEAFFDLYEWPGPTVTSIVEQSLDYIAETEKYSNDELFKELFSSEKSRPLHKLEAAIYHGGIPYFRISHKELVDTNSYSDTILDTYKSVLLQLEALVSTHLSQHYIQSKNQIYNSFFSSELKPSECWRAIASGAIDFIPHWDSVKLKNNVLVQVVLYEEGDRLLRVIGSTDHSDKLNRFVRVDKSVTGAALKSQKPWILTNPLSENQKNYVGYRSTTPQSELVIPLHFEGSVIGALNFEHSDKFAFTKFHIRQLCEYAEFISPLVHALNERHRAYYKKTISLTYAYSDMLSRLRNTYKHLLAQPMGRIGDSVAEVRYQIQSTPDTSNTDDVIRSELDKMSMCIDDINQHTQQFFTNLPSYLDRDKVSVLECINARLGYLKQLAKEENISITVNCSPELSIYASRFLQEHIYNIVKNSYDAITSKPNRTDRDKGLIDISAEEVMEYDALSQKMNVNNILLTISDNGGGVDDSKLPSIGITGFTTKGVNGNGFGVASARDYVETMAGTIDWENIYIDDKRNGFRTKIKLPAFNAELLSDKDKQ